MGEPGDVEVRVVAWAVLPSGQKVDIARYPVLAAAAPPGAPQLYAPITADDTVSNCCRHLVFALGMELMYPEQAERMRQARAYIRRPGPAAFGLTEADIRRQRHGQ